MVTLIFKRRQLDSGPKAKWLKGLSSIMLVNRETKLWRMDHPQYMDYFGGWDMVWIASDKNGQLGHLLPWASSCSM